MTRAVFSFRFAQVFCQMIHVKEEIQTAYLKEVLEVVCKEIELNQQKLADPNDEDRELVVADLISNMHSSLYFMIIYGKISANLSTTEQHDLKSIFFKIVRLCPTHPKTGYSLLHMACQSHTHVDEFHVKDVVSFPNLDLVKLLIETDAAVNAMDFERNTPLHLIVCYERTVADFYTLHSVINALIEGGAHDDTVNKAGQTPLTAATTSVAEIIMKSSTKISLKCIAANSIGRHKLAYEGNIPENLAQFVQLHIP